MSIFDNLFNINDKKKITGLTNELKALYVYNYYKQTKQNILIVCNSLYEASNFYQNLSNYSSKILLFPMDDFLTSEAVAISPELKTTRLETLISLINENPQIIVTNLMGYLRYLPTHQNFINSFITLKKAMSLTINELIKKLYQLGYHRETVVNKTGEIAVRGYVIDIFPIGLDNPIRIEYWGDEIDAIKVFNVDTQLTISTIDNIQVLPNTEFITDKDVEFIDQKQKNLVRYEPVINISNYIDKTVVFFDNYSQLKVSYQMLLTEIMNYNESINLSNNITYMHDFYAINNHEEKFLENFDDASAEEVDPNSNYISREIYVFSEKIEETNNQLNKYVKNGQTVVICLTDKHKIYKLEQELNNNNAIVTDEENIFNNKINIICKRINKGFYYQKYVFISETEIYNIKDNHYKYKTNFKIGTKIRDVNKLTIGDYVVHSVYGVGKYCGIKTLDKNGLIKDYLYIQYHGNDKLYIPVEKFEFISKYSSNGGAVPKLNKLSSNEWQKTKARVKKKIEDIAGELLKLYAIRENTFGYAFTKDTTEQLEFENEFIYEETSDQIKVINEIKRDMESSHPMDRLLCGDVGYGKTEVAFRAIFKAILSGKQVAFLCPTTILSNQHFQNALERFKSFPVNIALLNRFVKSSTVKTIVKKVKDGQIDLLIGTHRILSNDIIYRDLGLLVIDEEQRFGVKHKEKIKEYKNNIDVLTLSATPIPRTLQMSMTGIRNLSLIETPPVNRYPIQTYVMVENTQIIKDGIYKELSRNGQVFILYNKINNMEEKLHELRRLVPEAKIICAHGQMSKTELEDVMLKFIDKEYDVLLCTTIIETGIDIPNANTLIIIDADYFGLSQLYQIRGRVGRSDKIAYCYLMYNKNKLLNETAVKRLSAIKEFTELGSGFSIALRDLSIRGAGDILGKEQAGFIDSVGIEMFMQMLNDEINHLRGVEIDEPIDDQPLIDVSTVIDDKVASEEDLKIEIHKQINEIDSYQKLDEISKELEDRFGHITEDMKIYMLEELFDKLAKKLKITNVHQSASSIEIILPNDILSKLKVTDLFVDVSNISRKFKFNMRGRNLVITLNLINLEKHFVYYLVDLVNLLQKNYN